MKVLITGGAGYIGSSLIELLNRVDEIEQIIIYDNLTRGDFNIFIGINELHKVKFVEGDILDSYTLEKSLEGIDTVIHLAGFVSFPFNHIQNLQYEHVNRWGSLSVVRSIQKINSIKRVLYLSSTAVYGANNDIKESDEPNPVNSYGLSKLYGEQYFNLLNSTHELLILRSGNVFGFNTSLRIDGVINAFILEGITRNRIKIYGDGSQKRAFVSIDSVAVRIIDWLIGNNNEKSKILVDFNGALNYIKDWLITKVPNLEYQYLNQNQKFSGQSFFDYDKPKSSKKLLDDCFDEFYKSLRIKIRN